MKYRTRSEIERGLDGKPHFSLFDDLRALGVVGVLTVQGDCMAPDIRDGDFIFICPTDSPQPGDAVALRHQGEWCLKHYDVVNGLDVFRTADGRIAFCPDETTEVLGVVVGPAVHQRPAEPYYRRMVPQLPEEWEP